MILKVARDTKEKSNIFIFTNEGQRNLFYYTLAKYTTLTYKDDWSNL
jgi:hypothetical protein